MRMVSRQGQPSSLSSDNLMPIYRLLPFVCLTLSFLFCAKQGFPPGGPADTTPPRIIHTIPSPDTTRVAVDTVVEILFSEPVERRSCEESIFITPLPAEGVQYRWKGKKLTVRFPKGLSANRTYVITVGVGCKDRRNNPMAVSHSLAFATGDHLDQGSISGRIFSETEVKETQIWAYDLANTPDPNPAALAPLYVTQPDAKGHFQLRYLTLSRFRIFAVQDRDRNSRYNAQSEALAVANLDVSLSNERRQCVDLLLQLAVRDTTRPRLVGATALSRRQVDLQFSEKMAQPGRFTFLAGADTLPIHGFFLDYHNPAFLHVMTGEQIASQNYEVSISQGKDLAGHSLDSLHQVSFKASELPDTTRPRYITMSPRDSSKAVAWDTALRLWFSKAMDSTLLRRHFSMLDTAKKKVPGKLFFADPSHLCFTPSAPLTENMLYSINLPVDSIKDMTGNRLADTLFSKKIKTVRLDTLSEISGTISDQDSSAQGRLWLRARSLSGNEYTLWLTEPGDYRFKNIMPGSYTLYAYRDEDHNGHYTLGDAWPFQPSERFCFYGDTLSVRSRWPNEGNDLLISKP